MKVLNLIRFLSTCFLLLPFASQIQAVSLDGKGHYSLSGETMTNPGFQTNRGTFQGIRQSFRLDGEARVNDKASFFFEFRLFDDPRNAYLGDQAQPSFCPPRADTTDTNSRSSDCKGRIQDDSSPSYGSYQPQVRAAYARYAFDYCLFEAGRRPRHWGLGVLLNGGDSPFDDYGTSFDGVSCKVNVQKAQTLGFSVGFDKLQETGEANNNPYDRAMIDPDDPDLASYNDANRSGKFGATNAGDDIDQFFFTIEWDDRIANAGAPFNKNIGIYFANVMAPSSATGGSTDLKFLDLYTGLHFQNFLVWQNELVIRIGKSSAPVWGLYGGQLGSGSISEKAPRNNLNSLGIAGRLEWIMASSGSVLGPPEFRRGDATSHRLFLDYALAPGSEQAYQLDSIQTTADSSSSTLVSMASLRKEAKATSMRFHRNYRPALIMFNGSPIIDDMHTFGAFDPSAVMNASIFGLGYRYDSRPYGDFSVKFIKAQLDETAPAEVKVHFQENPESVRPVGVTSNDLGYELDLEYQYYLTYNSRLDLALAAAFPGDAWKLTEKTNPANSYLIQTGISLFF
jgi:hypothetical protein